MAYEQRAAAGAKPAEGLRRSHSLTLEDRKTLSISGVEEVESFDEGEIVMRTVLGELSVSGEDLSVSRLSVETGLVSVQGLIFGLEYREDAGTGRGLLGRLFH